MSAQKLIVIVMLVSLMVQSGLQVNRAGLRSILRNYSLLGRALLVNFVLVPLFAVALVRAFHLNDFIAVGILLMAIAPGVPFLPNAAGTKAGGSLGFALALCFVMPAISIVTAPLTARVVFPPQTEAYIPVSSLIVTLAIFQLVPLLVGMAISDRVPQLGAKLVRPLAMVVAVCVLAELVMLAPALAKSVATIYGTYGAITALLIVLFSFGAGWFFGGPEKPYRNTLALATVLRNVGLAFVVATISFPGTLVAPMVGTYFLVQIIVSVLLRKVLARSMRTPGALSAAH
jgi:BASS family bile acid:Na+ symporter